MSALSQHPFTGLKLHCYIDGQFVSSDSYFDNINPVNGEVIAQIAEAGHSQIDIAVESAKKALKGEWGKLTVNQRCDLLHKVADRMAERQQEFIDAEIADTGKPLHQVQTIDIPRGTANFRAFADMAPHLEPNKPSMYEAARRGFSTATDLADYVVVKGIPFRDAHEIVGKAVAYGIKTSKDLSEMSLEELQQFSDQITDDVFDVLTLEGSVAARNHIGGTAPQQVLAAAKRASERLAKR